MSSQNLVFVLLLSAFFTFLFRTKTGQNLDAVFLCNLETLHLD